MPDYTLAVGTHDPEGFSAPAELDAVRFAVARIESHYGDDLRHRPQDVVTLMSADGLITRPSERIDEFVQRIPGQHVGIATDTIQPGDTNAPDCNGD